MKPDVTINGHNYRSKWFKSRSLEYDNNNNVTFTFHIKTKWDIDFNPRLKTYYFYCYNKVINFVFCNIYLLNFPEERLKYDIFIQSEVCLSN